MAQTQERAPARVERRVGAAGDGERAAAERKFGLVRLPILPIIAAVAALVAVLGVLYWQQQTFYVVTDHAVVTGAPVQIAAATPGQVRNVEVDVGDQVFRGQVVASLTPAAAVGAISLRSPIDGVVVARAANPGDTLAAGRSVLTVVDPSNVWIQAQIEETQVGRVRPGQPVEVVVDSVGVPMVGQVAWVGRASMTALQASAGQLSSSNPNLPPIRTMQFVPVRIEVDAADRPLVLGGSAWVRIRVE